MKSISCPLKIYLNIIPILIIMDKVDGAKFLNQVAIPFIYKWYENLL